MIASWQLQVLEGELLLRLIPWVGGLCACRGREHRSNSVLLTIDLSTGEAFQQCFDRFVGYCGSFLNKLLSVPRLAGFSLIT